MKSTPVVDTVHGCMQACQYHELFLMEALSQHNLGGLKLCGDDTVIPPNIFKTFVDHTCEIILNLHTNSKIPDSFASIPPAALKQSHAATMSLFLESAKSDMQDDQLAMILDDCDFSSLKKEIFISTFNHFRNDLRNHLSTIGMQPPHIVDVGWRLDYNIKTNLTHKVNQLRYTISLKQESGDPIDFTCSREELQDLVGKLKEAAKAVERASQV